MIDIEFKSYGYKLFGTIGIFRMQGTGPIGCRLMYYSDEQDEHIQLQSLPFAWFLPSDVSILASWIPDIKRFSSSIPPATGYAWIDTYSTLFPPAYAEGTKSVISQLVVHSFFHLPISTFVFLVDFHPLLYLSNFVWLQRRNSLFRTK